MFSQLSLNVADESVCWLQDECIPEASFLDSTCGSTYPADVPATPATSVTRSANRRLNSLQSPQSSSSIDLNTSAELNLLKFSLSHLNGESEPVGAKPSRPNGTKTLSETSLSDAAQENYSELHSSELSVSYDKSVVTVRCAASEFSTSDTQCDTSSKNVTSELHGEPPGTSTTVETNGEDISITSMPTTTCKILSVTTERAEGKTIAAQKRLYGEGPALPDGPAPSDVSSNIKSLLPPLRTASQLLRPKPGSALSRRFDASTSGPPMTRQRAGASKNTSDAAQATRVSSSYRASKTGLPRPLCSGIPSGIQRPAAGLRPPSARSKASSSSHINRPRGPTAAANPVKKATQKPALSSGETLPIAKKKRMEAGSSTSASDAVGRHRAQKQAPASHPAVQAKGHECATCVTLKQQLKQKSEKIQRLKEELLKKS